MRHRAPAGHFQRLGNDPRELGVGYQHLRLGVVDHKGDIRRIEPRVDRVQHRPGHRHTEFRIEHRGHIGKHDGNGVILADAELRKGRTEAAGAGVELGISEALCPMHNRGMIRVGGRGAGQEAQRRQRLIVSCILAKVLRVSVRHYHHPNRLGR